MERVDGIGGFFFAASDPGLLSRWYAEHLGVEAPPDSYEAQVWVQQEGPTVFAPFGNEHRASPHLGPTGWGLNFRVRDLTAMVAQLRAAGIDVEVDPMRYPNGWFAQLHDPDGNAIQLWESQDPPTGEK
jgi:predicted enzyme related to lactoylglutathione lyase